MYRQKGLLDDITAYIKKNLKKGYTQESLRWALINQGYSKIEVEKAIKLADEEFAQEAPILKTKPEIKYEVVEPKHEAKKSFWKRLFGR
ncbi:hypothetical protein HYV50_02020 [Candidatus Pacearchaeota archaeon]|nr:hypothetical protein [Candidatus Pacearchaeota archaeon]